MDFNKIVTDSLVSGLRTILFVLRRLLVIPVITKFIGEESYGIWVTIIALVGVFAAIGRIHMHGTLIRYTKDDSVDPSVLTETLLITLFTTGVAGISLIGLVSLLNIFEIQQFSGSQRLMITVIAGCLVFMTGIFNFLVNIPRALGRVKHTEYLLIVQMAVELVIVIPLLYYTRDIIIGLTALLAISTFLNLCISVYYLPGNLTKYIEGNFRKYLSYGVPLMPKELSDAILSGADKFLILYFLSPAAAGVYSAVYSLCAMFKTGAGILNTTLYPAVTSAWDLDETQELRVLYKRIFKGYTVLAIPAFVGLILVSPTLLKLLATERIATQGTVLVPIIGFGFLIRALESPVSYILNAAERTHIPGTVSVGATVVNVGLNVVLIPSIGLIGAAIATLIANIILAGVIIYYAAKEFRFEVNLKVITKAILASAVMWITLIQLSFSENIVGLMVQIVTGVVIYFGTLILMLGVTRSDIRKVMTQ
jgi:O-antigen/teichoic acid export membrane protein